MITPITDGDNKEDVLLNTEGMSMKMRYSRNAVVVDGTGWLGKDGRGPLGIKPLLTEWTERDGIAYDIGIRIMQHLESRRWRVS